MPALTLLTYRDTIDHLVDYVGGVVSNEVQRDARRSILGAYNNLASCRRWSYYYQRGRITTVPQYSTGSVQYQHTGGAWERMLTLTDGTWPAWAPFGTIVIDSRAYEAVTRVSDTVLTLSVNSNPGADIAAGATYSLYRDTYTMPIDFLAADQIAAESSSIAHPTYVHPAQWLSPEQSLRSPSTPSAYTFMSDPNYLGAMAIRFRPAPDSVYIFDFIYQRQPRPLLIDDYHTGTVTVTGGLATVTGVGTAWVSKHIGSIIRVSPNATEVPVGPVGIGGVLYQEERVVAAVGSATSLTVDQPWSESLAGVRHLLSDPVDVEQGAMREAFFRGCEHKMAIARKMKDVTEANERRQEALIRAMEADSRSFAERGPSDGYRAVYRYANMPRGGDVG